MRRERTHTIVILAIVLLLSGVAGVLLLTLANLLPSERIKAHIANGAYVILQESAEYEYADGYVSAILDNYTDAVILAKTAWPSDRPLQDAINVPSYSWPGHSAEDMEIFGYLNGNSLEEASIDTYPRYWHGYMAILRPFFTVFSYADLRIMNQMLQLTILMGVLYAMIRRGLSQYFPAFGAMILFWNPATMGISLQYSPCYYISMIASLVVLVKHEALWRKQWGYLLFLIAGIMTAYLDFLTYPLVTLGVPLVFWILLDAVEVCSDQDISYDTIARELAHVMKLCVCWGGGYLGMWAEKWLYCSLLTGNNILADAASSVAQRTSASDNEVTISRLGTVIYLIRRGFGSWGGIVLVIVSLVVVTLVAVRMSHESELVGGHDLSRVTVAILILVGFLPFVWYIATANHSYIHPRLVYRTMGITIFAWLSAWSMLVNMKGKINDT